VDFLTPVIDSNCSLASLFIMHKIADEILAISKKNKKKEDRIKPPARHSRHSVSSVLMRFQCKTSHKDSCA
jgi:hypothetical protein